MRVLILNLPYRVNIFIIQYIMTVHTHTSLIAVARAGDDDTRTQNRAQSIENRYTPRCLSTLLLFSVCVCVGMLV